MLLLSKMMGDPPFVRVKQRSENWEHGDEGQQSCVEDRQGK